METNGGLEAEGRDRPERDELGAHVSSAGGVQRAPARAEEIESAVFQMFTKQPSRWAEPEISVEGRDAFRAERRRARIATAVAHDSYLINLSSPDRALWERSLACFTGELSRAAAARPRLCRKSSGKRDRRGCNERHRTKRRGRGVRNGQGE